MEAERNKKYKRHARVYRMLLPLIRPIFRRLFRLESQSALEIQGPYLVYANHNTDLDPVLVQLGLKNHLYFVASEHIFRVGLASRLLVYLFDPISRLKGSTDMGAVREVMRRLRDGKNVCIFAEGNRSFNGLTGFIPPSVGKLAKSCKVPVITYRFEGGYFTTPRWAYTMRKGQMKGYVANVYTVEQLKKMSADEVNAKIQADLFEDAYARQEKERIPFKGKRLAEGLETALFICPSCEQIGTLQSKDSEFFCTCGLKAEYDVYGYLHGGPYATITEWDAWQQNKLAEIASALGDEPAFADANVQLHRIESNHRGERLAEGSGPLAMYRDRLVCGRLIFPIDEISDMALYGRGNIAFTSQGKHYTIGGGRSFCGRKYLELYDQLKVER
ncbi:MAG: 1-acyl-sn-glycerol-3-phosphate acyltransferase [Firmicutes bacterium]|nr:1-acyl-sn-glycerol-3-phosphate acyltransferase [Bacillota bacterium]